uniref:Uncharacterized protein n=1 Tax=viral metagenome TaxID=1070528 RepID=A0A6C0ADX8_9ZZZZ
MNFNFFLHIIKMESVKIAYKIFKKKYPNLKISRGAVKYLSDILDRIYNKITVKVYKKDITKPIKQNFSKEMSKYIINFAFNNIEKFNKKDSLDLVYNYKKIKEDLNSNEEFAITIFSAIEYTCYYILSTIEYSKDVRERNILMSIRNDEELSNLVEHI